MERARVRTRQLPPLERSFERSRLEDDFITTAYEWVVPLRLIGHLHDFADRVRSGLENSDWTTRRHILQTLLKRVEVDKEEVRVVYQVSPIIFWFLGTELAQPLRKCSVTFPQWRFR